jgi:ssDNA-binding replication factor A large subunit
MGTEEVIKRILTQRSDITRSELEAMIAEKKEVSGDLLSMEGAAHLVAQDLLVETDATRTVGLQISDIIPQLGDATLTARVIAAWPEQRFKRKDESEGTFVRLLLGDQTGTIPCLVWNSSAIETLESNSIEGKIIRVSHGYTRTGLTEKVELHVGSRGSVTLLPENLKEGSHPPVEAFVQTVSQISDQIQTANVEGTVKTIPIVSSFQKEETQGMVLRMAIEDSTGTVTIVAWNERAYELKDLRVGDAIRVINGRVRRTADEQLELHLEKRSIARLLDRSKNPSLRSPILIVDLKPTSRRVSVIGRVLSVGPISEIQTKSGEKVPVSSILVGDRTGLIPVTLWRKNSKLVEELEEDLVLLIENAETQERLGQVSLNVGESGKVVSAPEFTKNSDPGHPPITAISQLKKSKAPVIVEGLVVEEPSLKEVEIKSGAKIHLASFRIRDTNETVRVSFWRSLAKIAAPLKRGDKIRIIGLRVKEGFADKWELHSSSLTTLKLIGKENPNVESLNYSSPVLCQENRKLTELN